MSRSVESIRPMSEGSEAMSNLTLLAETWGFEIEWDADLHRLGWEWYDSPGLLRLGPGFTPSVLLRLRRRIQRHLLAGSWQAGVFRPQSSALETAAGGEVQAR